MRLLTRNDGILAFVERSDEPYAILSHTWGEEEVTYEDVCKNNFSSKEGVRKIDFTLKQAAADGYDHVWVDTCCIDKKDRNELGEAINLMWKWYQESAVCYVYLTDVPSVSFAKSRWFTRGWTLQELLAPKVVRFYASEGKFLGTKQELHDEIFLACGVSARVDPFNVTVAERFRWSLNRQTTKEEDKSYCLVGLLEVSLLFNYGEGRHAQARLLKAVQEEHGTRALREIESQFITETSQLTIEAFMDMLSFRSMNVRRETISEQFPATCEWLLYHTDYQRWLRKETCLLWIKGGPGTGKSTLMKFAESRSDGISFYFNARGEVIEQTTLGMYRSLLWQLLRRNPHLHQCVLDHVNQQITFGRWSMTVHGLQACLRHAVTLLGEPAHCWIDALDECETKEVQEMVQFFEDLKGLFVCFASRYYPAISIRSNEILLEKQKHGDVQRYVYGRLRTTHMSLKRQVILKANGNFFWTVLVVRLINDDLANGNIYQIQQRLKDLPNEVRTLLRSIAMLSDDLPRFRLCVQWILFARRPMSAREFYDAMISSLREAGLAPDVVHEPPLNVETDSLVRFLASCSRGLAELSAGDLPRVQFIHESVQDYLLEGGLQDLDPETSDPASQAHEHLKLACQRYMSMVMRSHAWRRGYHGYHRIYPFMDYAVVSILYHADQAAMTFPQDEFLRNFDYNDDRTVYHIFELENPTGADPWSMELQYHKANQPLLSGLWPVLILSDCARLADIAYRLGLASNCGTYVPLLHAIELNRVQIVLVLLGLEDPQILTNRYRNEILRLCILGNLVELARAFIELGIALNDPIIFGEADHTPEILVDSWFYKTEPSRREVLYPIHVCASSKSPDVALLMIQRGINLEVTDSKGRNALHYSAAHGEFKIVEALIKAGIRTDMSDWMGRTALHYAAKHPGGAAIGALVKHGADMEARDCFGLTPLHIATLNLAGYSAHRLLELGCDVNARNMRSDTALHIAAQAPGDWVLGTLLAHGANPILPDGRGLMALTIALNFDRAANIEMLRRRLAGEEYWHYAGRHRLLKASGHPSKVMQEDWQDIWDSSRTFHYYPQSWKKQRWRAGSSEISIVTAVPSAEDSEYSPEDSGFSAEDSESSPEHCGPLVEGTGSSPENEGPSPEDEVTFNPGSPLVLHVSTSRRADHQ